MSDTYPNSRHFDNLQKSQAASDRPTDQYSLPTRPYLQDHDILDRSKQEFLRYDTGATSALVPATEPEWSVEGFNLEPRPSLKRRTPEEYETPPAKRPQKSIFNQQHLQPHAPLEPRHPYDDPQKKYAFQTLSQNNRDSSTASTTSREVLDVNEILPLQSQSRQALAKWVPFPHAQYVKLENLPQISHSSTRDNVNYTGNTQTISNQYSNHVKGSSREFPIEFDSPTPSTQEIVAPYGRTLTPSFFHSALSTDSRLDHRHQNGSPLEKGVNPLAEKALEDSQTSSTQDARDRFQNQNLSTSVSLALGRKVQTIGTSESSQHEFRRTTSHSYPVPQPPKSITRLAKHHTCTQGHKFSPIISEPFSSVRPSREFIDLCTPEEITKCIILPPTDLDKQEASRKVHEAATPRKENLESQKRARDAIERLRAAKVDPKGEEIAQSKHRQELIEKEKHDKLVREYNKIREDYEAELKKETAAAEDERRKAERQRLAEVRKKERRATGQAEREEIAAKEELKRQKNCQAAKEALEKVKERQESETSVPEKIALNQLEFSVEELQKQKEAFAVSAKKALSLEPRKRPTTKINPKSSKPLTSCQAADVVMLDTGNTTASLFVNDDDPVIADDPEIEEIMSSSLKLAEPLTGGLNRRAVLGAPKETITRPIPVPFSTVARDRKKWQYQGKTTKSNQEETALVFNSLKDEMRSFVAEEMKEVNERLLRTLNKDSQSRKKNEALILRVAKLEEENKTLKASIAAAKAAKKTQAPQKVAIQAPVLQELLVSTPSAQLPTSEIKLISQVERDAANKEAVAEHNAAEFEKRRKSQESQRKKRARNAETRFKRKLLKEAEENGKILSEEEVAAKTNEYMESWMAKQNKRLRKQELSPNGDGTPRDALGISLSGEESSQSISDIGHELENTVLSEACQESVDEVMSKLQQLRAEKQRNGSSVQTIRAPLDEEESEESEEDPDDEPIQSPRSQAKTDPDGDPVLAKSTETGGGDLEAEMTAELNTPNETDGDTPAIAPSIPLTRNQATALKERYPTPENKISDNDLIRAYAVVRFSYHGDIESPPIEVARFIDASEANIRAEAELGRVRGPINQYQTITYGTGSNGLFSGQVTVDEKANIRENVMIFQILQYAQDYSGLEKWTPRPRENKVRYCYELMETATTTITLPKLDADGNPTKQLIEAHNTIGTFSDRTLANKRAGDHLLKLVRPADDSPIDERETFENNHMREVRELLQRLDDEDGEIGTNFDGETPPDSRGGTKRVWVKLHDIQGPLN